MEHDRELEALAALTTVPGLGAVRIRQLVCLFGTPSAVIAAQRSDWFTCKGLTPKIADGLQDLQQSKRPSRTVTEARAIGVEVIAYTDRRYPRRLLEVDDHPVILYMQGDLIADDQRSIAIVGTRTASLYGREMARRFGRELAAAGFTVISGLARGVDTEAHCGALETGRTIAVIGSGLADIYPAENQSLARRIASRGALLSEFPIYTPPDRQNFPQRNRIVSAISEATLLVEALPKSGAMITMDRAISQGKRLFALPGRVDMPSFGGNHALIKSGRAQLVESPADIIAALSGLFGSIAHKRLLPAQLDQPLLPPEESRLVEMLAGEELSIDALSQRTQLPMSKLSVLLMGLVLKKRVKEFPGKIYKKY